MAGDTATASPSTGSVIPVKNKKLIEKMKKRGQPMIGDYYLGKKLGGGATAMARIGIHKDSGDKVALKILWKLKEKESRVRSVKAELKALATVKHENVVQFIDVDWNGKYPHKDGSKTDAAIITLELCENGELFDFLMHTGSFSDAVSRSYFHQLINGLEECHKKGVVHRDLKPDNLLMDTDFVLKIADFGFAVSSPENGEMHTVVGTEKYMAPEVVKGRKYTKACDIWSCGVILFVMYAGYPPYVSPNSQDWWFDKLLKGNFKYFWMAHEQQRKFDEDFKDLINKMLTADDSKRITIEQIKKHPWYVKDTYKQKALVEELMRRKPRVDNAKLEENLDRKNNSVEFAAGVHRGGHGGCIGTTNMPKLVELDLKTLPEPEEYEPEVKSYTTINSMKSAPQTLRYVISLLTHLGNIKFSRDGFSIECTVHTTGGKLEFAVDTFTTGKDAAVTEFRRLSGSFHEFRKIYQHCHDYLSKLEPKKEEAKN